MTLEQAGDHRHLRRGVAFLADADARDVGAPQHGEVGIAELVRAGEVDPDLEELERVRLGLVEQREHLGVHDAFAGGQPLHVAAWIEHCTAPGLRIPEERTILLQRCNGHDCRLQSAITDPRASVELGDMRH